MSFELKGRVENIICSVTESIFSRFRYTVITDNMASNYSSYASAHASGQFYGTLNPDTPLFDEVRQGYAPLNTPTSQLTEETEMRPRYSAISPSAMSGDTVREEARSGQDPGPGPSHSNPAQPGIYQPTPLPQRTFHQSPRKRNHAGSTGEEDGEARRKKPLSADSTDRVIQAISAMEAGLKTEIASLRSELTSLRETVAALEDRVDAGGDDAWQYAQHMQDELQNGVNHLAGVLGGQRDKVV